MKTKKFIYLTSFILTISFFQSCSEDSEPIFEENQTISEKPEVVLASRAARLTSSGLPTTTNANRAQSIELALLRRISTANGKNISNLNKRRISLCPRKTTSDSYFRGSPGDQSKGVTYYFTADPKNSNNVLIVTKMCKRGNKVFPLEYVKDDLPF